jgi:hypothetical protein
MIISAQTSTKSDTSRTYGHHKLELIAKKIAKGVACDSLLKRSDIQIKNDSILLKNKDKEITKLNKITQQDSLIADGQTKKLKEYANKEKIATNIKKANRVCWVIAGVAVLFENLYFAVKN